MKRTSTLPGGCKSLSDIVQLIGLQGETYSPMTLVEARTLATAKNAELVPLGQDNGIVVFGLVDKKTISEKLSDNCAKCGRPAKVTLCLSDGAFIPTSEQYLSYCEPCALQDIPGLPPCGHLVIASTESPADTQIMSRTYKVCGLLQEMNLAKIQPIRENNRSVERPALVIRCDTIPKPSRKSGKSFSIGGTALEIKLFEHSAPENRASETFGPASSN